MANELIKEKIVLNQRSGKEYSQLLLEGDIIVPDIKPDMAVLLKTGEDVVFDRTEVAAGRVSFSGRMGINVLYLAKGSEKSIHSISTSAPIEDFINMEGLDRDMWVSLVAHINNIDYRMLNDRKIGYRAVIDLEVVAESRQTYDAVADISDADCEVMKAPLSINRTVERKDDRFIVKDEIKLPPGKPNIREILQTKIEIANTEVRVAASRVNIIGELLIYTLYKGDDEESLIEILENELPFNGSLEVDGAREGMLADVAMTINDQYIQVRPDEDGEDRIIEIEVSVGCSLGITTQEEIELLEDAYCINKRLNIQRERISFPRLICRNKNQCTIKDVMQLDEGAPGMLQILQVGGNAKLDNVSIVEDKVIAEGIINADILYIANNDEMPIYNFRAILPFQQVIETRGAQPAMSPEVALSIDHIGYNMLSDMEVELRFVVSLDTKVSDAGVSSIITAIETEELDPVVLDRMPSITIYVAQKNDTLWKVAKRYNTSVNDIVALNDIENPDLIYPGQKILIVKKA